MTEKGLQDYLKKVALKHSVLFFKVVAVSVVGFPDVLLIHKGKTCFVELKSPKGTGKLSPRQLNLISILMYEGMNVKVIQSKEEVDALILRFTK